MRRLWCFLTLTVWAVGALFVIGAMCLVIAGKWAYNGLREE